MSPKDKIEQDAGNMPPSSYPGIPRTPTVFGKAFLSANDWISGKRVDDGIGKNLWRVHDKLYDLTPFIFNHPGGSHWLEMTQGTDITEAFESSHVLNVSVVEATLAKYFVQDAKQPRFSPFTFNENGFYKTLKRRIEPIMKEVGTSPTKQIRLIQDTMVVAFLGLAILGTWLESSVLKVLSGTILAWCLIGAHNFFHLRNNWRKYYYDLGLLSSYEWMITHSLSHHLYPNTVMDIELDLFPTFQFLPNRPKNFFQKYGPPFYAHLLYLIGFWLDFGKRIYNIIKRNQVWRMENGIVLAELALLVLIAPSAQDGFRSWILIHTVSSFVFLTIGSTAAHHHPEIFHDGDEARPDPDFGLCQLDATRDRAGDLHKNTWVILVTFGEHCLHHLFPTICHSKLHHIKGTFEQTLRQFSEEFPPMFQWELYLGCFQQLARTQPAKLKSKVEEVVALLSDKNKTD